MVFAGIFHPSFSAIVWANIPTEQSTLERFGPGKWGAKPAMMAMVVNRFNVNQV